MIFQVAIGDDNASPEDIEAYRAHVIKEVDRDMKAFLKIKEKLFQNPEALKELKTFVNKMDEKQNLSGRSSKSSDTECFFYKLLTAKTCK